MLDAQGKSRKVAIACQGGGSHTTFTAGVIKRLLRAEELKRYEMVGLSGTSGGAVCALLAWHNLLRGDAQGAAEALDAFWRDNSATAPHEQIINSWVLWASSLQNFITMPVVSPYYDNYFSVSALEEFKRMLERRVDFAKAGLQPEDSYPVLLVGAVDVHSGEFRTFNSRRDLGGSDKPKGAPDRAEDAELVSSAPFPGRGTYKGRARIRSFVTEYLAEELSMDLTRKQVARNGVAWTVRTGRGDEPANRAEGHVEAQFLEGKIKTLRLGDGTRSG